MSPDKEIESLLGAYKASETSYDEMWAGDNQIRSHWRGLLQQIKTLGFDELAVRKTELQRLLRENGVTYNIYGAPQGAKHIWKLDPIPFVLTKETWDKLDRGLRQRAQILDLVLKDLYGERKLIKSGVLPMELIYGDRNFLRPCDQLGLDLEQQLIFYAADISRGPDGRIWVVGDRTQAPSGWSYTIENRIAMARALPELFAGQHVRKILTFFQQKRKALAQFAPKGDPDPRIVLLTPGAMNETYFDQTYLAALQGFTLVKGYDLMVKDDQVWLKTLGGLEKVDIIVRRVDDDYCDPLSLRADSHLGVPGLLEVARAGNVRIANPLGSGILENPGLMAFLPSICRYYLGEELQLPGIASWWCGQEKECSYVLENLDRLVIKKINQRSGKRTLFGWRLSRVQKADLKKAILAFPYLYVAQEQAVFSSSPSFQKGRLTSRHTVLRCFLFASEGGYISLPGGLTRSAPEAGNKHVSGQSGGVSKDSWVIDKEPTQSLSLKKTLKFQPATHKKIEDLPSSTAENLFWSGRYGMRILYIARLLRVVLRYRAEIENFDDSNDPEIYRVLLRALTHLTVTYPGFTGEEGEENLARPDQELRSVLLDVEKIGGLANSIRMWKITANAIRDRWSPDIWRLFDKVEEAWEKLCEEPNVSMLKIRSALDELVYDLAALISLTQDSVSIEEGRSVFSIGMDLERGMQLAALLRATLTIRREESIEFSIMEAVLINNHSLTAYRYRNRHFLQLANVLDFILFDASYPQSIAFALDRLRKALSSLPKGGVPGQLRIDQKRVLKTYTDLQLVDAKTLIKVKEGDFFRTKLDRLLASIRNDLAQSANAIAHTYFSHIGKEHQQALFLFDSEEI